MLTSRFAEIASKKYKPQRRYLIDERLPETTAARIEPDRVLGRTVGLDGVPDGCRTIDRCEALKVLVLPSATFNDVKTVRF